MIYCKKEEKMPLKEILNSKKKTERELSSKQPHIKASEITSNFTQKTAFNALDKWLQTHPQYHAAGPMLGCGEVNRQQTASLSTLISKTTEK